jgi:hypothetical protein
MTASRVFSGFEDRANNGVIMFTKYSTDAFDQVIAGFDDEKLLKAGIAVRTRENLTIGGNPAFLATGNQFIGGSRFRYWATVVKSSYGTALVSVQYPESAAALYPDANMRAALNSITLRPDPPLAEQVAALPYAFPDLGKFRIVGAIAGATVGLTDGPSDTDLDDKQTDLAVTISRKVPLPQARQTTARQALLGLRTLKIADVSSEGNVEIGGLPAYKIVGRARNEKGSELAIVQWVVFGAELTLVLQGTSPSGQSASELPQLTAIAEGMRLK